MHLIGDFILCAIVDFVVMFLFSPFMNLALLSASQHCAAAQIHLFIFIYSFFNFIKSLKIDYHDIPYR